MSKVVSETKSTFKQLESIFQGILSLAAIIYTLGFIIVNSHYITYGVTDYQLIQTRYIAAGLSYLIIHLGIASMITTIFIVLGIQRKVLWLLPFFILWGLFGSAVYLFSGSILNSIIIGTNAGVAIMISYQMWAIWTGSTIQLLNKIQVHSRIFFVGIIAIVVIYFSALSWGQSYWPVMSSTIGGGRPNEAIFILDTKVVSSGNLPLIPMQNETATEQISILFDNASEFVVLVNSHKNSSIAVRIPKSIILAVIYAPPDVYGKKQNLPSLDPTIENP